MKAKQLVAAAALLTSVATVAPANAHGNKQDDTTNRESKIAAHLGNAPTPNQPTQVKPPDGS